MRPAREGRENAATLNAGDDDRLASMRPAREGRENAGMGPVGNREATLQ